MKGHLYKLGMINNPECDRSKQAFEMALHNFCDCKALAASMFSHLGQHFTKPGVLEGISVRRISQFVQGAALLNS
jgi:hypothetical protein